MEPLPMPKSEQFVLEEKPVSKVKAIVMTTIFGLFVVFCLANFVAFASYKEAGNVDKTHFGDSIEVVKNDYYVEYPFLNPNTPRPKNQAFNTKDTVEEAAVEDSSSLVVMKNVDLANKIDSFANVYVENSIIRDYSIDFFKDLKQAMHFYVVRNDGVMDENTGQMLSDGTFKIIEKNNATLSRQNTHKVNNLCEILTYNDSVIHKKNLRTYLCVCPYFDKNLPENNVHDFRNYNWDCFLDSLNKKIRLIDFRDSVYNKGHNFADFFYFTDNHWKIETAFKATQDIANWLKVDEIAIDDSALMRQNFDSITYHHQFKGAIANAYNLNAEDFTYYYPKKDIQFINKTSSQYERFTVRGEFCHALVNNTGDALGYSQILWGIKCSEIINLSSGNETKILVIGDSFCRPVAAYLACAVKQVDVMDFRIFDGSLRAYIEKHFPYDAVIFCSSSNFNFNKLATFLSYP